MDKLLVEAARKQFADDLFEIVLANYHKANSEYIQKQIDIAMEYLSEDQKHALADLGYAVEWSDVA